MDMEPTKILRPLTPKEMGVLEFIETFVRDHGFAPTFQEIKDHFGFASYNSVQRYLKQLQGKGYVHVPGGNQKRAITVLHSTDSVQRNLALNSGNGPGTLSKNLNAVSTLKPEARHMDRPYDGSPGNFSSSSSGFIAGFSGPKGESKRFENEPYSRREEEGVLSGRRRQSNDEDGHFSERLFTVPMLGRVAAGQPLEAVDHNEFVDIPAAMIRDANKSFALRVEGQSMIEDGIFDGDTILVQEQSNAANGEVVVAVVDNEATVKRFFLHRDRQLATPQIELRPANSEMEPMWYSPSEVEIRGVVVGLLRTFI